MLMTDQQRYDSLSSSGNNTVHTPNIDRIAERGVSFERAYANCPECVPARHEVISGRNALRTGVLSNAGGDFDANTPTLMSILAENGYFTQGIGKTHFVPFHSKFGFHDVKFSEELGSPEDDDYMKYLMKEGYLDHVYEPKGMRSQLYYVPQVSQLPKEKHCTHWVADESIRFLNDRAKKKDEPFYLFASFIQPHPPFDPPTPYQYKYLPNDMKEPIMGEQDTYENYNHFQISQNLCKCMVKDPYYIKTMRSFYHACVSFIDDMVGRMLEELERLNMLEDTIIMFTSDHGDFMGDHGCYGKRSWYDGPARIPYIYSYPKALPQGKRNSSLAGHRDIMPTLLSLAGIEYNGISDGKDLSKTMIENEKSYDKLFGILDYNRKRSAHAVITDEWKYMYSTVDQKKHLIHYSEDHNELVNHAFDETYEDVIKEMEDSLKEEYKRLDAYHYYFEEDGTWKKPEQSEVEWDKTIREAYLNPDSTSYTGRLFQFPSWNGLNDEMMKRVRGEK